MKLFSKSFSLAYDAQILINKQECCIDNYGVLVDISPTVIILTKVKIKGKNLTIYLLSVDKIHIKGQIDEVIFLASKDE